MIGALHGGKAVGPVLLPKDHAVGLLGVGDRAVGPGKLRDAVAVDVLRRQLTIGSRGGGEPRAAVQRSVDEPGVLLPDEDIRHSDALAVDAGDEHRRGVLIQLAGDHTALIQLRHGAG